MQSKPFYDSMILWKIMYLNISQSCQLWVQYPSEGHQREQREWENGFVKGVSPFLIQAIRITRTRWRQEKERKDICGPRWEILKCTSLQQTRNSGKKNEWGASLGAEDQWWEKHKSEFPADFFFCFGYYWSDLHAATKRDVQFLGRKNYQLCHTETFTTACFGKWALHQLKTAPC